MTIVLKHSARLRNTILQNTEAVKGFRFSRDGALNIKKLGKSRYGARMKDRKIRGR